MKIKLMAFILMVVLCLSVTGCGSTQEEETLGTEDGYYITFASEVDIESIYFEGDELVIVGIIGYGVSEEEVVDQYYEELESDEGYKEYRFVLTDQTIFEDIGESVIETTRKEFEEWINNPESFYQGLNIIIYVEDGTVSIFARAS